MRAVVFVRVLGTSPEATRWVIYFSDCHQVHMTSSTSPLLYPSVNFGHNGSTRDTGNRPVETGPFSIWTLR